MLAAPADVSRCAGCARAQAGSGLSALVQVTHNSPDLRLKEMDSCRTSSNAGICGRRPQSATRGLRLTAWRREFNSQDCNARVTGLNRSVRIQ